MTREQFEKWMLSGEPYPAPIDVRVLGQWYKVYSDKKWSAGWFNWPEFMDFLWWLYDVQKGEGSK